MRLRYLSIPLIVWLLVLAVYAHAVSTRTILNPGDTNTTTCYGPKCPPCPVCPVCPAPDVPVDMSVPEVQNMSNNYFSMSPYSTRMFRFMVTGQDTVQIHIANMLQYEPSNIDMFIKPCSLGLPKIDDSAIISSGSMEYKEFMPSDTCYYILLAERLGVYNSKIRLNPADLTCNKTATCPPAREYQW